MPLHVLKLFIVLIFRASINLRATQSKMLKMQKMAGKYLIYW